MTAVRDVLAWVVGALCLLAGVALGTLAVNAGAYPRSPPTGASSACTVPVLPPGEDGRCASC